MTRPSQRLAATLLPMACLLIAAGCSGEATSSTATDKQGKHGTAAPVAIGTNVGLIPPAVSLQTLKGDTLALSSLKGKVVLVNFWATWCGPCLMEMPSMQRLYQTFRNDDFEILAISGDFEGASVVKPYVDRLRLSFPILLDPQLEVNDLFKVTGIPTSILIDRDGIITHKFFGAMDWDSPASQRPITQMLRAHTS